MELSPCAADAASPSQPSVEGDGSLGAGRPFLAAPELGHASFVRCGYRARSMDN